MLGMAKPTTCDVRSDSSVLETCDFFEAKHRLKD